VFSYFDEGAASVTGESMTFEPLLDSGSDGVL